MAHTRVQGDTVAHGVPERRGTAASLRDTVSFYAVLILFWVMCLAWSLPAAVLFWIVPRQHRPRVGQYGIRTGFRVYLWVMRIAGLALFELEPIDALADGPPLVIACNHRSLLDAVMVISRLPRVVCITKASLWDNTFLGGGIRMAAYIRNERPLTLIRAASAALRSGQHLLIFPEGTRSASGALGPFRPGFALMAKSGGVAVQTVILESNSPYLRKGWGLFRRPSFPLRYRARLGRRFDPSGDCDATAAEIERYFHAELG